MKLLDNEIKKQAKMIREMRGERILLDAEWLEENDPKILDWITSLKYWDRGYNIKLDRSQVVVELQFDKSGVKYFGDLKCSKDKYPSLNQSIWGEDNWQDWSIGKIEKYYKLLRIIRRNKDEI
jgi:hypothetical protein